MLRMHPGRHGRSIDFRRADIGRVMIAEEDAILRQAVKHGTILRRNKIRAHAVPNDQHDMLSLSFGGKLRRVEPNPNRTNSEIKEYPGREKAFHLYEKMPKELRISSRKTAASLHGGKKGGWTVCTR